jgi:ribonucleoside-diphosphate reductase beta chain
VFDTIIPDEIIRKHAKTITKEYERLYELINMFETDEYLISEKTLRKALWLALISVNILEGIRFYVAVGCGFAFAESKEMEGNAKELKFIARDENMHLALTQKIINILRKDEKENFIDTIEESKETVLEMYKQAAKEEIEWAEYLFQDGSILGLNTEILTKYMEFITNQRLKAIGLQRIFDTTSNPLPWMDAWLGSAKTEQLPQETELSSYLVGALDKEVPEEIWS